MNDKPPRAKKPQRQKGPITPLRPDQWLDPEIGLRQEKLVGRVVVEWSRLEAILGDFVWQLLRVNEEDGRLFTERTDATRLLTILNVLAPRHLKGELLDEIVMALRDANNLRDDRNFIAHGGWATLMPNAVPIAASLRAKAAPGSVTSEHFPPERMLQIIKDIKRVRAIIRKATYALDSIAR